ncbi:MatE family protein [Histomonas meleagridis]|uniref:MatE family protein n=1 Tax=Histomonas meleagridis TaxID=135588 RepID=UPI00355A57EC|nr:MatE family protein [Histomonas meleagridis]KAH0796551.1 MatE family protein [Histomonas meleagridis]
MIQSIGPLMYNIGNALHDVVDLLILTKAFGQDYIQIPTFSSIVRFLIRCFSVYFSNAASAKIPSLIGARRHKEAEQVITDLFRLTLIFLIIIPILFLFISKPLLKFMGCSDSIADKSFQYLLPVIICGPFTGFYQMGCGFLQSEGLSITNGAMQLFAFILNCCFFSPILFFLIKVDSSFSGLPFALSQVVPSIVLFILIYRGKFSLKPTLRSWRNGFSKETFDALKLSSPFILNVLAGTIPPILLMNYLMKAANAIGVPAEAASGFSLFLKIQTFVNSFSLGINQALLTTGRYSYGSNNLRRLLKLFVSSILVSLTIVLAFMPPLYAKTDKIVSIWISDEMPQSYHEYAIKMLRIPFYTNFVYAVNDAITSLVLSANFPVLGMIPSIVRAIVLLASSLLLYYTNQKDPVRMMFTFCISDGAVLLTDLLILIKPMMKIRREIREYLM